MMSAGAFKCHPVNEKGKTPSEKNFISHANFTFETKSSFFAIKLIVLFLFFSMPFFRFVAFVCYFPFKSDFDFYFEPLEFQSNFPGAWLLHDFEKGKIPLTFGGQQQISPLERLLYLFS